MSNAGRDAETGAPAPAPIALRKGIDRGRPLPQNWGVSRRRFGVVELAALAGILAATFLVFRPALHNPFHFDDSLFLENPDVTEPGDLRSLLRPIQIRSLTYLSLYVNYRLGGTHPYGYHAVNLALHLCNVAGVYLFVRLLTSRLREPQGDSLGAYLPLAAAALFALHPIQSEAVNYVYQRSTLLAALFSLAALGFFLLAEERPDPRPFRVASVVSFLLAVAGKESAVALPAVLLLLAAFPKKDTTSLLGALRRARGWLIGLAVAGAAAAGWMLHLLHRFGQRTPGVGVARIDAGHYLLSEIQVIPSYLRLLVWPIGLTVDHEPRLAPLVSPYAALCLTLVAGIVAAALGLRRRCPLATFLTLAFFVFLAPTSTVMPSADLMFEHRLYLPMIAAAPLLALLPFGAARALARRDRTRQAVAFGLVSVIAAGAGVASRARTHVWGDNVRLWEEAVARSPGKARAHYNLGVSLLERDRARARRELGRALELRPDHAPTLYNLGWLEQTSGRYDSARRLYEAALAADGGFWQALHNLGNLDVVQNRLDSASERFRAAIRLRPDYWPSYLSLATLELRSGAYREARRTLEKVHQLRPGLLEAHYLVAYALVGEGDLARAEAELRFIESKDHDGLYRDRIEELRRRAAPGAPKP